MHLSSKGQQEFKTKRVKDCMERIGHLEVDVQPCLMQENPWYYRNKVQMPLGYDKNGQLVTGFINKELMILLLVMNVLFKMKNQIQ